LKHLFYIFLFIIPTGVFAQDTISYNEVKSDTSEVYYYIIEGDTIPREFIDLEEVVLLNKLQFNSKEDRRRYLILRRKTRKIKYDRK